MPDFIRPADINPDPIVTAWAVEASNGPGFVNPTIAPSVPVGRQSFQFPTYLNDELNDEVETLVKAPARPNLVRSAPATWAEKTCLRRALDDFISDDTLKSHPNPMGLQQRRTAKLTHRLQVGVEKRVKTLLDASGTAASAPSVKWDAATGVIEIEKNVDAAIEAFILLAKRDPTHIMMNPSVARVVKRDPTLRALNKTTTDDRTGGEILPPYLFGLKTVIPGALVNSGNPKADFSQTIARVWSAQTCYILAVDPNFDMDSFTGLAQAYWSDWGTPYAGYQWRDSHLSVRGMWLSVEIYQTEFLVSGSAIYRIPTVLT